MELSSCGAQRRLPLSWQARGGLLLIVFDAIEYMIINYWLIIERLLATSSPFLKATSAKHWLDYIILRVASNLES